MGARIPGGQEVGLQGSRGQADGLQGARVNGVGLKGLRASGGQVVGLQGPRGSRGRSKVSQIVVFDTLVFLLNEYFVELNRAKFKILN